MNPYVKCVQASSDHELEITFENGEVRTFDVTPFLDGIEFKRLRDPSLFRAARVVAGSVEWPGGLDLSYDTLYLQSRPAETLAPTPATNAAPRAAEQPRPYPEE